MKPYRNTILIVAVAALLLAVYFFIDDKSAVNGTASDKDSTLKLLDINTDEVEKITINNNGIEFVIKKQEEEWKLIEPSGILYDKSLISGLPLSLHYISVKRIIEDKPDSLAKYGLDKPAIISAETAGGQSDVLEVGNITPTKDGYYLKSKGSDRVYTVDTGAIKPFLLTKAGIRDKNVLSSEDYKKLFVRKDEITGLTFERNGEIVFSATRKEGGVWKLVSPAKGELEDGRLDPVLDAVVRIVAIDFVDDGNANLEKYGLDKPACSLEFENAGGVKKVLIGREKVAKKEFYALVEGTDIVFTLDETGYDFLDKSFSEITGK